MKKPILPILFLAAIVIFIVIPDQKKTQAAPGVSPSTAPVAPAGFLLDWSSDSFIPFDYRGKALAAKNSTITVTATPLKAGGPDPDKLFYNWQINGQLSENNSGQNRAVFKFKPTGWPGQTIKVRCLISDASQKTLADKTIEIALAGPQVLFYDPAATNSYAIKNNLPAKTGQKIRLLAVPLFFRSNNPADINYNWQFDGQKLSSAENTGLDRLTLGIPEGQIATTLAKQLTLSITDKNDPLQQASANLQIDIQP